MATKSRYGHWQVQLWDEDSGTWYTVGGGFSEHYARYIASRYRRERSIKARAYDTMSTVNE